MASHAVRDLFSFWTFVFAFPRDVRSLASRPRCSCLFSVFLFVLSLLSSLRVNVPSRCAPLPFLQFPHCLVLSLTVVLFSLSVLLPFFSPSFHFPSLLFPPPCLSGHHVINQQCSLAVIGVLMVAHWLALQPILCKSMRQPITASEDGGR